MFAAGAIFAGPGWGEGSSPLSHAWRSGRMSSGFWKRCHTFSSRSGSSSSIYSVARLKPGELAWMNSLHLSECILMRPFVPVLYLRGSMEGLVFVLRGIYVQSFLCAPVAPRYDEAGLSQCLIFSSWAPKRASFGPERNGGLLLFKGRISCLIFLPDRPHDIPASVGLNSCRGRVAAHPGAADLWEIKLDEGIFFLRF